MIMFGHWLSIMFYTLLVAGFLFYSYRINKLLNEE